MLGGLTGMPLYEYQCEACGPASSASRSSRIAPLTECPKCGGAGPEADLVAGLPVQGFGLVHHRLRAARRRQADSRQVGQVATESTSHGDIGKTRPTAGRRLPRTSPRRRATPSRQLNDEPRRTKASSGRAPRPDEDLRRFVQVGPGASRQAVVTGCGPTSCEQRSSGTRGTGSARSGPLAARNRRRPSGSRACCRCRGGRRSLRRRRAAASPAGASGRW